MRPMSWYWGSQETLIVAGEARSSWIIIFKLWARFPWEIITPFGSDVDPDVYCKNATSICWISLFCSSDKIRFRISLWLTWRDLPLRIISSIWIHWSTGHFVEDVENIDFRFSTFFTKLYWEFVRTTCAPELIWMFTKWWRSFFKRRGSGGKTGTAITPAIKQARRDTVKSSPGKKTSNTRSPALRLKSSSRLWDRKAQVWCKF